MVGPPPEMRCVQTLLHHHCVCMFLTSSRNDMPCVLTPNLTPDKSYTIVLYDRELTNKPELYWVVYLLDL